MTKNELINCITDIISWEEKYYSTTSTTSLSSTYIFTTSTSDYYSQKRVSPTLIMVKPDGHCGYRALSYLLFQNEDYWQTVRTDMANYFKKIMIHNNCASLIWDKELKDPNFVDRMYNRIQCVEKTGFGEVAKQLYWFFIPDCLTIASYCYQRIIVLTSQTSSSCVGVSIPPMIRDKPMCIHWISENHFAACKSLPTVLPPVFPTSLHWIDSSNNGKKRKKTMQIIFESYMENI